MGPRRRGHLRRQLLVPVRRPRWPHQGLSVGRGAAPRTRGAEHQGAARLLAGTRRSSGAGPACLPAWRCSLGVFTIGRCNGDLYVCILSDAKISEGIFPFEQIMQMTRNIKNEKREI